MTRFPLLVAMALGMSAWVAPIGAVSLIAVGGGTLTGEPVAFRGNVIGADDLSGVAAVGDLIVIVSDEIKNPTVAQVLRKDGAAYRVIAEVELPAGNGEVDLEGVATEGDMVYVTGSHSHSRTIKNGILDLPERKKSREQLFRFRVDAHGKASRVGGPKSLTAALKANDVLNGFVEVAGKENGIDIEGLAVRNGRLYFGLRGPVLRDGWVPIVTTTWDDPATVTVVYVGLDGRGVRDLVAVDGGFLILAGPVGDGDGSYRVYFWNGEDQLTGGHRAQTQRLAEFTDLNDCKPEGLAVLGTRGQTYQLLMVCDGVAKGGATRWTLSRP